jgi:hypothetical protein
MPFMLRNRDGRALHTSDYFPFPCRIRAKFAEVAILKNCGALSKGNEPLTQSLLPFNTTLRAAL